MFTNDSIKTELTEEGEAEWIAAHPEVSAAAPSWSNTIVAMDDVHRVAIGYDRVCGSVTLGAGATWADGVVAEVDLQPTVYFSDNEHFVTADDLRRYAADFLAAADALAAAERGN